MTARAIRCGTLFDGTGAAPVRDAGIIVEDGRITAVGPADATTAPPGADTLDLSDRFVMPGLIDCHTHASIVPGPAISSASSAAGRCRRRWPPRGISARIWPPARRRCGSWARSTSWTSRCATPSRPAIITGPRLLVAGRGLAANNGHGRALTSYDGVDEVRRGARENLRRGANHVKIFVTGGVSSPGAMSTSSAYTREEIRAAVEEAERAGTYAAAHAHGGAGLRLAVAGGRGHDRARRARRATRTSR